jgi:hypothetical protein
LFSNDRDVGDVGDDVGNTEDDGDYEDGDYDDVDVDDDADDGGDNHETLLYQHFLFVVVLIEIVQSY